jgi:hypothetical protein
MDPHVFDSLTRQLSAPRSRRAAWRALVGAALLGATTRAAMADSSTPCRAGNQEVCGGQCCPGRCFMHEPCKNIQLCCTGKDLIICEDPTTGKSTCCYALDEHGDPSSDPCRECKPPPLPDDQTCFDYIGGSYRRR